jgi:hypothetical protein
MSWERIILVIKLSMRSKNELFFNPKLLWLLIRIYLEDLYCRSIGYVCCVCVVMIYFFVVFIFFVVDVVLLFSIPDFLAP